MSTNSLLDPTDPFLSNLETNSLDFWLTSQTISTTMYNITMLSPPVGLNPQVPILPTTSPSVTPFAQVQQSLKARDIQADHWRKTTLFINKQFSCGNKNWNIVRNYLVSLDPSYSSIGKDALRAKYKDKHRMLPDSTNRQFKFPHTKGTLQQKYSHARSRQDALEQLCRRYVDLTQKVLEAEASPDSELANIQDLEQSIKSKKVTINEIKLTALKSTAAASRLAKLEARITKEEEQLATLKAQLMLYNKNQVDWTHTVSKFMLIANDLDERLYTEVLHQATLEYYDSFCTAHNAANALRHVGHAVFLESTHGEDFGTVIHPVLIANATSLYPRLVRARVDFPLSGTWNPPEITTHLLQNLYQASWFMILEVEQVRQELDEKAAALIQASDQVASIRSNVIKALFDSCGVLESESEDVAGALKYDRRCLAIISNYSQMEVEPASNMGVRFVDNFLTKKDVGRAVGLLYPELNPTFMNQQ
ncbi:hypothetical protein BCR33DRAFT_849019 [Rhizoclosmatium globosum]|uniref:Uncharacterized protein n=1 Tax=Rhizoclosmatium globosum TaxID=329046 RepID=A0A1Y2CIZ7_9FUNG|nr:hypothetical protein BCR33DRAFT_849019 [Rhizoclosmatium globosum]|eukprot:ORY47013.1 hypothetical protein BCR33DRAFT_849019 [Rhizoclosmatium globosum]